MSNLSLSYDSQILFVYSEQVSAQDQKFPCIIKSHHDAQSQPVGKICAFLTICGLPKSEQKTYQNMLFWCF